jgi:cobalt-zinc-cadmium efflux system outer membrane protein
LADAQFQKAFRHYAVVRDQIALEVRQSLTRYRQAQSDLKSVREELLPALNQTIEKTERAWEGGEVSYLFVLDSIRRVQGAKLREAESLAEAQRAAAELERSVGSSAILKSVEKSIKP